MIDIDGNKGDKGNQKGGTVEKDGRDERKEKENLWKV
jgi:hypothetical protein